MPRTRTFILLAAALAIPVSRAASANQAEPVDFTRDVRPILAGSCFACHGPDEGNRQAGLRLDRRPGATRKLESGTTAVVPGNPQGSELVKRITADDEFTRMPPADSGKPLTGEQIEILKEWIGEGAPYERHWAFVKPTRPPLPDVKDTRRPASAIDYFVQARLKRHGLEPSPRADRYTLIRRLSFDLRGLPPTPEEVEEFIADDSPAAYQRLVDRFLADPAFGERWARMWLDLARYADSKGYGSDPLRKNIWPYRDWVIGAFNRNLPYDRFTIEQLAGDLLENPSPAQRVATAFHRNTMTNTEGGTDDEEFRVAAIKDRVDTTVQVWMGLTMGCAKCHSHKYDPIAQREYYRFYAFFNQTADADRGDDSPLMKLPTPELSARIAEIDRQLEPLRTELRRLKEQSTDGLTEAEKQQRQTQQKRLQDRIRKLQQSKPQIPTVPVMQELPPEKRRTTHVMVKGNFLNKGQQVEAGWPQAFHRPHEDWPANRLGVGLWLIDPDNPLTARVAVNRFWARLFGVGIVETEEDFGTQGEPPSHPLLLDWLATEFVRLDWDMKALLRLMVTSETYKQSSRITPLHLEKDPRNRLLSRGPRFRLEAEMVRDQALQLSGLLCRKIGGPSVYPPQPAGLWRAAFNGRDRKWPTSSGGDRYRRGVYTFWRRTVPYPAMDVFDAPSREVCTVRRIRTNTPLQALVTMNDPAYVEAAQALARRIVRDGGDSSEDQARFALRLSLCRPPHDEQVEQVVALFVSEQKHYADRPQEAESMATDPLGPLPETRNTAELAAWTVVSGVLLNMDGVLVKR